MASENSSDFNKILSGLKAKKYAPVYFLYGTEHYYIDELCNYAEHHILNDGEKGFNQTVLYGKDADVPAIVNAAKRFPRPFWQSEKRLLENLCPQTPKSKPCLQNR